MQKELRRSYHVPYNAPVQLTWTVNGRTERYATKCVDISGGGFGVELPDPIPLNTSVKLDFGPQKSRHTAWVRHVRVKNDAYVVGLELTPESIEEISRSFGTAKSV
jgi:hypothetical protein